MKYHWIEEILSVIEFLKISKNDVMKMSICDRKSFIFAHNEMIKKQKEEAEKAQEKANNKGKQKVIKSKK
jgi:hypothetical protein